MRHVIALLVLSAGLLAQDPQPLPEGASLDIVIQEVQGEVDVQAAPKGKWVAAERGLKLAPGAKVCTGVDGQAALLFGTNGVAVVTEASIFEIRSFGMRGDELVAEAFIDPGVAHVSVKQLETFQTDFRVSTPRLTCSVKGSAYTIWSQGGAGLFDQARCNEHLAQIILANLQQWVLAAGLLKDTSNDTPEESQSRRSTTNLTPQGTPPSEQVARLVLLIAHTLAQDPGSLTLGTSNSPLRGESRLQQFVRENCSPQNIARNLTILRETGHEPVADYLETGNEELRDIAQGKLDDIIEGKSEDPDKDAAFLAFRNLRLCLAAAQVLEERPGITTRAEGALLFTTIDNLDVVEHLGRDGDEDFNGGIDDIKEDMFLYARRNGFPAFQENVLLDYLNDRFMADPQGLLQSNPGLFNARYDDFRDDGSGFSLDDLDRYLADADEEAHSPVTEDTLARVLMSMLHVEYHIVEYAREPGESEGGYEFEHQDFHEEFIAFLEMLRQQGDFDRFLAAYLIGMIESWEDRTDCDDDPDPEDECFEPRQHYLFRLLDVLQGFRGATGRFQGYQTQQELDALHVLTGFSDVRHHVEPEDVDDFWGSHQRREFERQVIELVGLAASADLFEGRPQHEDFEDLISSLQETPEEKQRREDHFHDLYKFGYDAYLMDWQAVQDQARLETLQPHTLGHALLDTVHKEAHLWMGGLPSGNQPGQYDYQHDLMHQAILDPLHATLEQDFPQFTHDLLGRVHDQWHQSTGVPLNPDQNDSGFGAHVHFHQSLDQLHSDMHAATGTND